MQPINNQSKVNPQDYATRLKGEVDKAVTMPAPPPGPTFEDKFQRVEGLIHEFETSEKAVHRLDPKGNPVTVIPDIGSLKRTARGFELSILRHTYNPHLGQGGTYGKEGFNVQFRAKTGEMKVDELQEKFPGGGWGSGSLDEVTRSSYTLNLEQKTLDDLHQSKPKSTFDAEGYFGTNLSLHKPSITQQIKDGFDDIRSVLKSVGEGAHRTSAE